MPALVNLLVPATRPFKCICQCYSTTAISSRIHIIPNLKVISDPSISKSASTYLTSQFKSSGQVISVGKKSSTKNDIESSLKKASKLIMKSCPVADDEYKTTLADFVSKHSGGSFSRESARLNVLSGQVIVHSDAGYAKAWKPQSILDMGRIRIDPNFSLRPGQMVSFLVGWKSTEEVASETKSVQEYVPLKVLLKENKIDVLFEDGDIKVLSKPAGLASHGGSKQSRSLEMFLKQGSKPEKSYYLVHRLDKDTTGAIVIAKRSEVASQLAKQFENGHGIMKLYLGVIVPRVSSPTLHSRSSHSLETLMRTPNEWVDLVSGIRRRGSDGPLEAIDYYEDDEKNKLVRKAHTRAKLLVSTPEYSLIAFQLMTGRKHQIRLQCQHHFNSILLGDEKYGKSQEEHMVYYMKSKKSGKVPLFLHAWYVEMDRNQVREDEEYTYPIVKAVAPIPSHFTRLFSSDSIPSPEAVFQVPTAGI